MKKLISVGMTIAIVLSMTLSAFAATTHTVEVYLDNALTPSLKHQVSSGSNISNLKIFEQGKTELSTITIESESYASSSDSGFDGMSGVLPNGTTYTFDIENSEGNEVLYLSTSNVVDDMKITLETSPTTYMVSANSGEYGSNNNYGDDYNATCVVSEPGKIVNGGDAVNFTFTPFSGKEISKFNIRTGYSNQSNLISVKSGSFTVDGLSFSMNKLSDGSISVSCESVTKDIFITALTEPEATEYSLTVNTDANVYCDIFSDTIYSDESYSLTFIPDEGYSVYKLLITQGNTQKAIYTDSDYVYIGNQKYEVTRSMNGSVTLRIPPAVADVQVDAVSNYGSYFLQVTDVAHVSSNYSDNVYVGAGEDAIVTLTPDPGYNIYQLKVQVGSSAVTVSSSSTQLTVSGKTYRMEKSADGTIYLYLTNIKNNIKITPYTTDNTVKLTVSVDNGVICNDTGTLKIESGSSKTLTFFPKDDNKITEIKVTRNNTTYTATSKDAYLTINNIRCPVSWKTDGTVTITLYSIDKDITVKAESDYSAGYRYITRKADMNSTITHDADNSDYAKIGESVNITITPKNGYKLTSVRVSTSNSAANIYDNTSSFYLNNRTYTVSRSSNGTWTIHFSSLPASITIESHTETESITTISGYHNAYINGIGKGLFAPDRNMTRAEAVAMLTRLYYGTTNVSGYSASYSDVSPDKWYDEYVGWAEQYGLLERTSVFRPDAYVTRAEFLDMIVAFSGVDVTGYNGTEVIFNDLPFSWIQANQRTASQIAYAVKNGWITGYSDQTFRPNNFITRAELVALTNRATGRIPNISNISSGKGLIRFFDVPNSHWAYNHIMEAANSHYYGYDSNGNEQWNNS